MKGAKENQVLPKPTMAAKGIVKLEGIMALEGEVKKEHHPELEKI